MPVDRIEAFLRQHDDARHWLGPVAKIFAVLQAWIAISLVVDRNPYFNASGVGIGTMLAGAWVMLLLCVAQSRGPRLRGLAALAIALGYATTLAGLFLPVAWKQDFGGFPAIGDGQSIIKHAAIAALAAWIGLEALGRERAARLALAAARYGVIMVLLWIGGAKFTSYEAEGIDRLLLDSPVLGWMRQVWDVRGVSDIIGVVEILTGLVLLGWPHRRRSGGSALMMCGATFLTTLTFLFSLPGWSVHVGAPWLGSSGVFFIEDQFLLLVCVLCVFLERGGVGRLAAR